MRRVPGCWVMTSPTLLRRPIRQVRSGLSVEPADEGVDDRRPVGVDGASGRLEGVPDVLRNSPNAPLLLLVHVGHMSSVPGGLPPGKRCAILGW
jgi:hypothetical protein